LKKFYDAYASIQPKNWRKNIINATTMSIIESEGLNKPEALNSIGTAISGSRVTPPIYDSLEKLGQAKTLKRLDEAVKKR
jgi:glutamyl/glutaminyl-tRNA synthetase